MVNIIWQTIIGIFILLLGATLIFIMGLWDDIRPLPAFLKFISQILVSLLVIVFGNIHLTFFYQASWTYLINIPLTVLWIVGLTNAMNFFDGIDGLAPGMSILSASFLGLIAFKTDQPALGWFAVALLGACIGFIPYNFRLGKSALIIMNQKFIEAILGLSQAVLIIGLIVILMLKGRESVYRGVDRRMIKRRRENHESLNISSEVK